MRNPLRWVFLFIYYSSEYVGSRQNKKTHNRPLLDTISGPAAAEEKVC